MKRTFRETFISVGDQMGASTAAADATNFSLKSYPSISANNFIGV